MAMFKICPICNAFLDPAEQCDCTNDDREPVMQPVSRVTTATLAKPSAPVTVKAAGAQRKKKQTRRVYDGRPERRRSNFYQSDPLLW